VGVYYDVYSSRYIMGADYPILTVSRRPKGGGAFSAQPKKFWLGVIFLLTSTR